MKKIISIILMVLILTSCTSSKKSLEKKYSNYIKELKSVTKTSDDIPFDIEVSFDKLTDNEVRYQVIIDNSKEDIYSIEALAIHNKKTDDIFPSIGIFDDKENLLVNKKPSGIILVGYIDYEKDIEDFKCEIKVLIKYKDSNKKSHKVHYVTKK